MNAGATLVHWPEASMSKLMGDPFLLKSQQGGAERPRPAKTKPMGKKKPERTFRDFKILGVRER